MYDYVYYLRRRYREKSSFIQSLSNLSINTNRLKKKNMRGEVCTTIFIAFHYYLEEEVEYKHRNNQ